LKNWIFGAALLTVLLAVIAFAMAVTTLPRSGPSCTFDVCVSYPYTDIAQYYPRDYLWMIPATLVLFPFLALVASLYGYASEERKSFGLVAISFAAIPCSAFTSGQSRLGPANHDVTLPTRSVTNPTIRCGRRS